MEAIASTEKVGRVVIRQCYAVTEAAMPTLVVGRVPVWAGLSIGNRYRKKITTEGTEVHRGNLG